MGIVWAFLSSSIFSPFFLPLSETARYRLKYVSNVSLCWAVKPQETNTPKLMQSLTPSSFSQTECRSAALNYSHLTLNCYVLVCFISLLPPSLTSFILNVTDIFRDAVDVTSSTTRKRDSNVLAFKYTERKHFLRGNKSSSRSDHHFILHA